MAHNRRTVSFGRIHSENLLLDGLDDGFKIAEMLVVETEPARDFPDAFYRMLFGTVVLEVVECERSRRAVRSKVDALGRGGILRCC
jgi:hypothetical protein